MNHSASEERAIVRSRSCPCHVDKNVVFIKDCLQKGWSRPEKVDESTFLRLVEAPGSSDQSSSHLDLPLGSSFVYEPVALSLAYQIRQKCFTSPPLRLPHEAGAYTASAADEAEGSH